MPNIRMKKQNKIRKITGSGTPARSSEMIKIINLTFSSYIYSYLYNITTQRKLDKSDPNKNLTPPFAVNQRQSFRLFHLNECLLVDSGMALN